MGTPAVRIGDILDGHDCYGTHFPVTGSPNVIINGIPSVRINDLISAHCCGPPCHSSSQATGSPTVFVNGRNKVRIGDFSECGSVNAVGSPNVLVGP